MDVEEVKANIGKEVVVGGLGYIFLGVAQVEETNIFVAYIRKANASVVHTTTLNDIKLKEEKEMKEYKIRVANEAESKEAQELFFELGYEWSAGKMVRYTENPFLFAYKDKGITTAIGNSSFIENQNQEITLPQLRDLAVLHRNDVGDATHKNKDSDNEFLFKSRDNKLYYFNTIIGQWQPMWAFKTNDEIIESAVPITQESRMAWQEALHYIADGKDVQYFDYEHDKWLSIKTKNLSFIMNDSLTFQLAPPTIHLEEGDYTKEGLLKIAGEME